MKKISFILFIIISSVLVSCQNNSYTIEGTITDAGALEGKTIFLQKIDSMNAEKSTVIDSVVLKNGKFKFTGSAVENDPFMGFISVGKLESPEPNSPVATIILEPGTIKITMDKNTVNATGTPRNDEFNKVQIAMNNMAALYKEINEAGGVSSIPDFDNKMKTVQEDMQGATFNFAKSNMKNKAGQFLFYSSLSLLKREQIKELLSLADSSFINTPELKMLHTEVNKVIPEVGQPFTDVQLVDLEGNPVKLSDYAGKSNCTLIDFWASWCGPCIQEMPHLVNTYKTYKDKGLQIVGISVDEDKDAWLEAVKKYNMSWIQLADATRDASASYNVQTIPHTILLDSKGVIIAKDLRGKELEDKIAEILK